MVDETVTVTLGTELLSPVQFNTIQFGPYSMTTKIRPDETEEQAMDRAYTALTRFARRDFRARMPAYLDKLKEAARMAGR